MPIYEYQCKDCAAVSDVRHGFKETNTESCRACGGELKRRFTPTTGIVFKGSGFYVTDSRTSAAERTAKKSDGAAKSGEPADGNAGAKGDTADKTDAAKADSTAST
ncbi:MAG: FmdB family transcriptional regulator, partial [Candidatus Eremiobacteraeota bacterium]|nr:FmdB family transcriptional regulator [Candidatus Eremiobacteraeota bacterium]